MNKKNIIFIILFIISLSISGNVLFMEKNKKTLPEHSPTERTPILQNEITKEKTEDVVVIEEEQTVEEQVAEEREEREDTIITIENYRREESWQRLRFRDGILPATFAGTMVVFIAGGMYLKTISEKYGL